jgi:hypothetical protein
MIILMSFFWIFNIVLTIILSGIQLGFLCYLSTVSTFAAALAFRCPLGDAASSSTSTNILSNCIRGNVEIYIRDRDFVRAFISRWLLVQTTIFGRRIWCSIPGLSLLLHLPVPSCVACYFSLCILCVLQVRATTLAFLLTQPVYCSYVSPFLLNQLFC